MACTPIKKASYAGLVALIFLLIVLSSNQASAHNGQTLTLSVSREHVTLDGKIDEKEWSDAQKLSMPSPNHRGLFVVLYKYDVDNHFLYFGLVADDDTPARDDAFGINFDTKHDGKDIDSDDYLIVISRMAFQGNKTFAVFRGSSDHNFTLTSPSEFPYSFDTARTSSDQKTSAEIALKVENAPTIQGIRFVYTDSPCIGCEPIKSEFGKFHKPDTWYDLSYLSVPEFPLAAAMILGLSVTLLVIVTRILPKKQKQVGTKVLL